MCSSLEKFSSSSLNGTTNLFNNKIEKNIK